MTRDPFVHAKEDLGNIREWIAGRGGARTVPPATIPVPPEPNDAVEAPQTIVAAPIPKPDPVKPERCLHCNGPLPALRSAAARYCSRKCTRAAAKARRPD